jgi:hypothetical protein
VSVNPPLKDKVFSTSLDQNPPLELLPQNGVSPPTKAVMRWSAIDDAGASPPKAKVTRSNRVGCASFFEGVLVYVTGWFELLQEHQQGHIQVD